MESKSVASKCARCGLAIVYRDNFGWHLANRDNGYICSAYEPMKSSTMEHEPEQEG